MLSSIGIDGKAVSRSHDLGNQKISYRRLALQYHPDRCSVIEDRAQATERFKEVSQAYQILSDPTPRANYDASLASSSPFHSNYNNSNSFYTPSSPTSSSGTTTTHYYHPPPPRPPASYFVGPFVQFDDLFRNDAFFRQAFGDLEEEFARQFQSPQPQPQPSAAASPTHNEDASRLRTSTQPFSSSAAVRSQQQQSQQQQYSHHQRRATQGWIPWLLRQCGIQIHITTRSTTRDGSVTATSYSTTPRHKNSAANNNAASSSGYTNQTTRTYRNPTTGKVITVRSMERNGQWLQESLENGQLIERRINGRVVPISSPTETATRTTTITDNTWR
ncbi:hypothetical protein ACA910_014307 [Epithemia clementina (nom. ined.)]